MMAAVQTPTQSGPPGRTTPEENDGGERSTREEKPRSRRQRPARGKRSPHRRTSVPPQLVTIKLLTWASAKRVQTRTRRRTLGKKPAASGGSAQGDEWAARAGRYCARERYCRQRGSLACRGRARLSEVSDRSTAAIHQEEEPAPINGARLRTQEAAKNFDDATAASSNAYADTIATPGPFSLDKPLDEADLAVHPEQRSPGRDLLCRRVCVCLFVHDGMRAHHVMPALRA
ncbi:hypothetical protein MRX96_035370 [Rhipicephalus microplus]